MVIESFFLSLTFQVNISGVLALTQRNTSSSQFNCVGKLKKPVLQLNSLTLRMCISIYYQYRARLFPSPSPLTLRYFTLRNRALGKQSSCRNSFSRAFNTSSGVYPIFPGHQILFPLAVYSPVYIESEKLHHVSRATFVGLSDMKFSHICWNSNDLKFEHLNFLRLFFTASNFRKNTLLVASY